MNCEEVRELLNPLFDGELAEHDKKIVQAHLQDCMGCQSESDEIIELHNTLASTNQFNAPDSLRANIKKGLNTSSANRRAYGPWGWRLISHSIAAAVGAIAVVFVTSLEFSPSSFEDELLALHIQSLGRDRLDDGFGIDDNLVQVESSDRHTVKPWFAGKVDFSPPVPDLSADDFSLIGGRIEQLNGRNIVALVYGRRKHMINLFVDLSAIHKQVGPSRVIKNGYSVASVKKDDFIFWAVSDISEDELNGFLSQIVER